MQLPLLWYGLLACVISLTSATALTYRLAPNEKACFFTWVEQKNAKIAFYFAVSSQKLPAFLISRHEFQLIDWSLSNRFKREAPSTSITVSQAPTRKSSCRIRKNDRATSCSPPKILASTGYVSTMRCRRFKRRWWTSR